MERDVPVIRVAENLDRQIRRVFSPLEFVVVEDVVRRARLLTNNLRGRPPPDSLSGLSGRHPDMRRRLRNGVRLSKSAGGRVNSYGLNRRKGRGRVARIRSQLGFIHREGSPVSRFNGIVYFVGFGVHHVNVVRHRRLQRAPSGAWELVFSVRGIGFL